MPSTETSQTFMNQRTLAPRWAVRAVAVLRGLGWRASWRASNKTTWTRWPTHHRSAAHWARSHESAWTRWSTHHWAAAHRARPHEPALTRWSTHHRPSAHRAAPLVICQSFSRVRWVTRWSGSLRCNSQGYAELRCSGLKKNKTYWARANSWVLPRNHGCACLTRPHVVWRVQKRGACIQMAKMILTPMPPGLSELFIAPIPREPEPIGPRGPALAGGRTDAGPVGIPPLPMLGPAHACNFQPHKVVSCEAG